MRKGWSETTLGDIAEYINGYPFKPSDLGDEGTAVIRIKQLLDPMEKVDRTTVDVPERCVLSNGDIVFSWSGTLAVRVWNRGTAFLNQHLFRVVEKSGISHEWLPLVIDHAIDDLVEKSHGTTMKHITKQTLLPHQVLLPPLEEQKRIVDLVSSVDAYIDALQQQANLTRIARKAIEVAEFDNPENELSVLGDYCAKNDIQVGPFGSQLHQHEYVADGIPVVMPKNIVDGRISEENIARITAEKASELKSHSLIPGDVLFARRGDLSKRALVTKAQAGWLCGTGTVRVRSKKIDGAILFRLTNTSDVNTWLMDNSVGATMPNLNTAIVASIPLRVPGNASEAVALLRGMDEYLDGLTNLSVSAMELRSGLLSDLLSGEHEIPESYDRFLKAA